MKLVKSLLLGSAAGLATVVGAQAADLPVRKAAPVDYVRICTAYGAGYFFIPGTDTCLKIGGRVRAEFQVSQQRDRASNKTGYRVQGRMDLDARTQTAFGTLRTFVRYNIAHRSGALLTGTGVRQGEAITAVQPYNQQVNPFLDAAFIQFAGFTAGRATSVFDFYQNDVGYIAHTGSAVTTQLFSYTAVLGGGFTATLSVEDPTERRFPVYTPFQGTAATIINPITGLPTSVAVPAGSFLGINPITGAFASGAFTANTQPVRMPDFVAAVQLDQAWGSLKLSGAVHEIVLGGGTASTLFNLGENGFNSTGGFATFPGFAPDAEYGFALQAGAKINLPMIAAGDVLWLQAAYADGATSYTLFDFFGSPGNPGTTSVTNRFGYLATDAAVTTFGDVKTTKSFSAALGFLHYWTPNLRSGFNLGYGRLDYSSVLQVPGIGPAGAPAFDGTVANRGTTTTLFRDTNIYLASANLIYTPVRGLDIGVEVLYQRVDPKGRAIDFNQQVLVTGVPGVGRVARTVDYDDQFIGRLRVQRDF